MLSIESRSVAAAGAPQADQHSAQILGQLLMQINTMASIHHWFVGS